MNKDNKMTPQWIEEFEELFDKEMRDERGVFPNENEQRGGVEIVRNVFVPFISQFLTQQLEEVVKSINGMPCKDECLLLKQRIVKKLKSLQTNE